MSKEGGTRLTIRVVPNASRSQIVGWLELGVLKLKVAAPPEGGRANKEVVALLATSLGLSKREIEIASGETSRQKTVAFLRVTQSELVGRLNRCLTSE